ncbi:MAG: hypothetical protein L0Y32_03625, partial [Nevskiales bacterium]|nr:hypothetical protein [Nevskiales bacterium]
VFLFIGGGARRSWLEQECRRRGLGNVKFQPYQPRARLTLSLNVPDVHLISLNPAFEGLVLPSKFYGIAAAGRPVLHVGDRDGDVSCLVREAECGDTITPGNVAALTARLQQLASDPAGCARLGANARRAFEARFDRPLAVRAWTEALQSVSSVPEVARVRVADGAGR